MERSVGRAGRTTGSRRRWIRPWAVVCLLSLCGTLASAQDTTPPTLSGGMLCLDGGGEPCEVALEGAQSLSLWVMLIVEEETCLADENALTLTCDNPVGVFRETNRELNTSDDPDTPAAVLVVSGYLDVDMQDICAPETVTLTARAVDCAGNETEESYRVNFVDNTPPWTFSPSNGQAMAGLLPGRYPLDLSGGTREIDLSFSVVDNYCLDCPGATVSISLRTEGGVSARESITVEPMPGTLNELYVSGSIEYWGDAPGTVTMDVSGQDASGLTVETSVQHTLYEDVPPTIALVSEPQLVFEQESCTGSISFTAEVSDNWGIDADAGQVNVLVTAPAFAGTAKSITETQTADERVTADVTITLTEQASCPGTVELVIVATDNNGNQATPVSRTVEVSDSWAPVIDFPELADVGIDATGQTVIPIAVTVTDNCRVDPADVTVSITPSNVTVLSNDIIVMQGASEQVVEVGGSITVHALAGCPASVMIGIGAADLCGSTSSETRTVGVLDEEAPVIAVPKPADVSVDGTCQAMIPISGIVTDSSCLVPSGVTVSVVPTNVLVLSNDITKTQGADAGTVDLGGSITVHQLTGCPAQIEIGVEAMDSCGGNSAEPVFHTIGISDDEVPNVQVDVLPPIDGDDNAGSGCTDTLPFEATVIDNCCIDAGNVLVTVELAEPNAMLDYEPETDLTITQVDNRTVSVSGRATVRCLTGCPARLAVTVDATDCCGNLQTVESSHLQGRIYDRMAPESSADDVNVNMNLPLDIDVLANDEDNCMSFDSGDPCSCCGMLWIHNVVALPAHGTATILDDAASCGDPSEIRYEPETDYVGSDQFSYRATDACGNLGPVTWVSIDVVHPSELLTLQVRGPGDVDVAYGTARGLPVAYLTTHPGEEGVFGRWAGEHGLEVREDRGGGWVLVLDERKEIKAVFSVDPWERTTLETAASVSGWRTASIPGVLTSDSDLCAGATDCDLEAGFVDAGRTLGEGFWLWLDEGASLAVETACPKTYARVYLIEGWNLIGSPFGQNVPLSGIQILAQRREFTADEAVAEGILGAYAFAFTNGGYTAYPAAECCLEPWIGYYIWANEACELKISQPEDTLSRPMPVDLAKLRAAGVPMPPSPPDEP